MPVDKFNFPWCPEAMPVDNRTGMVYKRYRRLALYNTFFFVCLLLLLFICFTLSSLQVYIVACVLFFIKKNVTLTKDQLSYFVYLLFVHVLFFSFFFLLFFFLFFFPLSFRILYCIK